MNREEKIWEIEEAFHSKDRKAFRKEKKHASLHDRSQFKKTDQNKQKQQGKALSPLPHFEQGQVCAILPEGIVVCTENVHKLCTLRGALKKEKNRLKTLIAVGDRVYVEGTSIREILPRSSVLSRADHLSRKKEQLIAANIDHLLIITSVVIPALKPALLDRYIIAAQKGNLQPVIVINKIDLLHTPSCYMTPSALETEKQLYTDLLAIYTSLSIPVFSVSTVTGEGIEQLQAFLTGQTSVCSGQSGVGKSSLINALAHSCLPIGDIVWKTRKGSHTTTTTQLIPLAKGGHCIDTPGIKSFGLWDLSPEDLRSYFSEITALAVQCKFPDCAHINEPQCAVKAAISLSISPLRFGSYCALMTSLSEPHRTR